MIEGLITFAIGALVLAIVIYIVHLVMGMLTLPANVKQIALVIIGLIGLLVLLNLAFNTFGRGPRAIGAPAPAPPPATRPVSKAGVRPLTAADFAGEWELTWGIVTGPVTLGTDGAYHCEWGGRLWVGRWSFSGGRFRVSDAPLPDGAGWLDPPTEPMKDWQATITREGGNLDGLAGYATDLPESIVFRLRRAR